MKKIIVSIIMCACAFAQAEETVFQRDLNNYTGVVDGILSANAAGDETTNLWGGETLQIAGIPTEGWKQMGLIRFDNLFGTEKNQIPPGAKIRNAQLGLYKVGEPLDEGQYASAEPWQLFVTIHRMITPFHAGEPDAVSEVYSCHAFRGYGKGEDEYWGDKNKIEVGPVVHVDYIHEPIGRIPLEVNAKDDWYWVDVTNEVQGWAAGDPNHGFFLRAYGWWIGATFASGQYHDPTLRPKLIVEWER